MTVLTELLEASKLDSEAIDHIQLLLSEWQILADLSFADLVLFVHHELLDGRPGYLCVGQMRPYTAQTIYMDDLVGMEFTVLDRPMVARAFSEGRVIRDADPDWSTGVPVREEAIPVRYRDEVVAVVTREANVATARSPSQLELTYLQAAGQLARMLAEGLFPYPQAGLAEERELAPRVGDGIAKLDGEGIVTYASPNAISAYRRMGHLDQVIGVALVDVDPVPTDVQLAFDEQAPITGELELEGATVIRRVMPLLDEGVVTGALVLVREVTELRRHQRALRIKDATIREIHHRVKNNLQTVASLLRLQTRRLESPEAKSALEESVRRISSIAMVHETLSQESGQKVSFEVIANRVDRPAGRQHRRPRQPGGHRGPGLARRPARRGRHAAGAGLVGAACRTASSTRSRAVPATSRCSSTAPRRSCAWSSPTTGWGCRQGARSTRSPTSDCRSPGR